MANIPVTLINELKTYPGRIVTRFPPEPSGCLHIGHAKACFINAAVAKLFNGTFILRFDDTNPEKESAAFVQQILADMKELDVVPDIQSSTSNYFEKILQFADQLVHDGCAYVDDSSKETIGWGGMNRVENKNRHMSIPDCTNLWDQMKSRLLTNSVLRIKLDMTSLNGTMRDPIIFRYCATEHFVTKNIFCVYPTYDFSCPIVDALEGVSHVFRSNEFIDRDEQYYAILGILGLPKPIIHSYGKLNFDDATPLSKRSISALIQNGSVTGWDDPRLLTIQGAKRRGLTVVGLKRFLDQIGCANSTIHMKQADLWNVNKAIVANISTRYTVLPCDDCVRVNVGWPESAASFQCSQKLIDRFVRNPDMGQRFIYYSDTIILKRSDVEVLSNGTEITLMSWGNMIYDNDLIANPDGNPKTTKHKLAWLCDRSDCLLTSVNITSFKGKGVPEKIVTSYFGEPDMINIKKGDFIQLMKMNYYICDSVENGVVNLIETIS